MSRSKAKVEPVRGGVESIYVERWGEVVGKTRYSGAAVIDNAKAIADGTGAFAYVRRAMDTAKRFLEGRGLPGEPVIRWDKNFNLIAADEIEERLFVNVGTLCKYLERRDFEALDNEMLAAKIICFGADVLNESNSIEARLGAMNELTVAKMLLSRYEAADRRAASKAKASRKPGWTAAMRALAAQMQGKYQAKSARWIFNRLDAETAGSDVELRRDGDKFYGDDPDTGEAQSLSFSSWQKYFRAAGK